MLYVMNGLFQYSKWFCSLKIRIKQFVFCEAWDHGAMKRVHVPRDMEFHVNLVFIILCSFILEFTAMHWPFWGRGGVCFTHERVLRSWNSMTKVEAVLHLIRWKIHSLNNVISQTQEANNLKFLSYLVVGRSDVYICRAGDRIGRKFLRFMQVLSK